MPSPTCQVKEGAGAFQPTTNGVDVTAASALTIDLTDKTVDSWELECLTTDELSDHGAVTAALVIDYTTKQATLTAPAQGHTYRFRSRVDGGNDLNGIARSSYSTTFCIYVPSTVTGRRCLAADERFEGHPDFGWLASINALIRNPTSAVSVGAADAIQTSDGAGALQDSGLTGAAGVLGATSVKSDDYKNAAGGYQLLGNVAGDAVLGTGAGAVRNAAPVKGLLGAPNGFVTIDMNDADYAAVQAEYDQMALREGGAHIFTGVRNLSLPDATDANTYFRLVWCNNANAVNLTVSDTSHPGVTIAVSDGMAAWIGIKATGAFRASPEFDPTV